MKRIDFIHWLNLLCDGPNRNVRGEADIERLTQWALYGKQCEAVWP